MKRVFITLKVPVLFTACFGFVYAPRFQLINAAAGESTGLQADSLRQHFTGWIDSLCVTAEDHYYRGRLDEANRIMREGKEVLDTGNITLDDCARFEIQYAKMIYYQSSARGSGYDSALAVLQNALVAAERSTNPYRVAQAQDLMGLCLYSRDFAAGRFEPSSDLYQKALTLRQQIGDSQGVAETKFHIGLTFENKKDASLADKQKALGYYREVLQISAHKYPLERSYALRHIAGWHQDNGQLDSALVYFKESLRLRESIGFLVYAPFSRISIGDIYAQKNQGDSAMAYYETACRLAEKMNIGRAIVYAFLSMGDWHQSQKDARTAETYFKKALSLAEKNGDKDSIDEAKQRLLKIRK